jgi:hypothetical protein
MYALGHIPLTWQDNSRDEIGFIIFRDNEELRRVPAEQNSFDDGAGLQCETEYRYFVESYNLVGPSDASNPASASTLRCPTPEPKPVVLSHARVWFWVAGDDGKDHDTRVDVEIDVPGGINTAGMEGIANGQRFDLGREYGPFELMVRDARPKNDFYDANVKVQIHTHGNDRWKSGFRVQLDFTDGSHLSATKAYEVLCYGCPSWDDTYYGVPRDEGGGWH